MPGKAGGTVKPLKKGKTEGKDLSAEDIALHEKQKKEAAVSRIWVVDM